MAMVSIGKAVGAMILSLLLLLGMAGAARAAPQGGMTQVGHGVRLHYLDFGGRGDPVILLAGLGNTAWIYEEFGTALARHHRVLALTRRGHGASDQPASGYDLDTLAEDIRRFMDAHAIRRAHLIGHSLAGAEMTYFAGKYPDRVGSLIYLEAAYDWSAEAPVDDGDPIQPGPPEAADQRSIPAFLAYVRRTRPDLVRYWRPAVSHDLEASVGTGPDGIVGWRTRGDVFGALLSAASQAPPDYRRIRAPALAIYSSEDEAYRLPADATPALRARLEAFARGPLEAWRRLSIGEFRSGMREGEVVRMDAGHHLFLHRPGETRARIDRFLARHPIAR
jgi:pimeloyl-ACP methyl ester carboxylesterase